ncbi:pilus assembly protein PilP [Umboniibacter marinipuniceus]|uniref:Type IV pilus assembly protein PilP n=1 Tax=Umboniibacter marinipuniceus TaxID=569599 RepID=A0A3M0ACP6_9GAMM|nr:pilus assembly protein PilP [Umboniibacter marinipuniceus]RMA82247.1 type IV pilus assembly protein PilP [Umboniibacter marinipuniceus]
MKKSLLSSLALVIALSGCAADQSDLQGYVNQVKARPAGRVEPLPEFAPYETFVYAASGRRAPFEPPVSAEQMLAQRAAQVSEIQPPVDHTPQPLELYAISDLRMIGYVDHQGSRWATLQDGSGSVHRIGVGSYIGKNYGRITKITSTHIELLEIVPNGPRSWIERPRTIQMVGLEQLGSN